MVMSDVPAGTAAVTVLMVGRPAAEAAPPARLPPTVGQDTYDYYLCGLSRLWHLRIRL